MIGPMKFILDVYIGYLNIITNVPTKKTIPKIVNVGSPSELPSKQRIKVKLLPKSINGRLTQPKCTILAFPSFLILKGNYLPNHDIIKNCAHSAAETNITPMIENIIKSKPTT